LQACVTFNLIESSFSSKNFSPPQDPAPPTTSLIDYFLAPVAKGKFILFDEFSSSDKPH
jgi:hypothetical protein